MNRKIKLSILITLCVALMGTILFFGVNSIKAEATEREITASGTYGDVSWTLYDDGELYIGGEGVIGNVGNNSQIPWNTHASKITQITIGKDVVYDEGSIICKSTNYSALTEIFVEKGNTSLLTDENGILFNYDKSALILFPAASSLSEYSIPDTVTQLVNYSFYSSNLKKIVVGESVSKIGWSVFSNCDNLTDITLYAKITSLGRYIFSNCDSLESITIPEEIAVLSIGMFSSCKNLKTVVLHDKLKIINDSAFAYCSNLSEIAIPTSVYSIGRYAFRNCENLETIEIPSQVETIDFSTFQDCTGLKKIILGENTTTIKSDAFKGCEFIETIEINSNISSKNLLNVIRDSKNLKEIIINAENEYVSCDENGVLFNKDKTELLRYPSGKTESAYIVPDTAKKIGTSAFEDSTALTDITIPPSIEYIGTNAFLNTGFYKDNANWDNGFLYIGTNLVAVDSEKISSNCKLYSKTTLVASRIFEKCNITSLDMSDNVKYINDYTFINCDSLKSVKLSSNLEALGIGAFYDCDELSEIEIPKKVSEIENFTFYGSNVLSNIILNEGLSSIGENAFYSLPMLTEIYIPETVTSIDSTAFTSSGVTDIYFGSNKADWKRAVSGESLGDMVIHYTLRSDDESVIINHTDDNFDYEAGNVHLVVTDLGKASSSYEQNGFYNRLMADPIQVLDIKLVDGDGNDIQPLSDETITVKIKASEEFMNLMKSGLSAVSEYDIEAENIDFSDDCFVFENNGETVSVAAEENFLKKFKVIHWFSDAVEPTDHESFAHDELSVENGYIVLKTNHFSEYAVCTELVEFELGEIELANGKSTAVSVTVSDGTEITYTSSDKSVVTVDENGVITAVGPGTATITVTVNGTNISDTCVVTVPARDYTIKWIVDGVETEQTVTEQAAVTQPEAPEKEGCTFVGWTPEVPDTMPAQNLEFNAVWQVNQYTITFDTAGGSAVAPITIAYGSEVTASENPILEGYVFRGWTPAIPETMPAYDMTLTAVYEKVFVSEINIISLPSKTQYTYRIDSFDLSGIAIQVVYSDGSKEVITDTNAIKAYGFSADSTGTKTVTVEYGGCTAKFDVIVSYAWWQWIIRILLLGFLWY